MQVQFGRTVGLAAFLFGVLLLSVQLWLWTKTINPPASAAKENSPADAPANHRTTWFPGVLGGVALVGGIFIYSKNLLKPEDQPVHPAPRT